LNVHKSPDARGNLFQTGSMRRQTTSHCISTTLPSTYLSYDTESLKLTFGRGIFRCWLLKMHIFWRNTKVSWFYSIFASTKSKFKGTF